MAQFEFGISRHAPKQESKGEKVDVRAQEVDRETAGAELESRARALLENLEQAPKGAIMALEPSNVKRAEQTRDLYADTLEKLLAGRDDIRLVKLGDSREISEKVLEDIRLHPEQKFILQGIRGTWLIGFKDSDPSVPATNKWKNTFGANENLLGKVWAVRQDEIPAFASELHEAGFDIPADAIRPAEFAITPEERVARMLRWIEAMRLIGEKHFPNRPLILEGVSHNLPSDYTTLFLLGEDISLDSINRVLGGKFRAPYERSSVRFDEGGTVTVTCRDQKKTYTPDEFEERLRILSEKITDRKREWGIEQD